MNRVIVLALLANAMLVARTTAQTESTLRVMTFNVRNSHANDGANGWKFRRELFAETVRRFDPDLLGLQEVLADQHDDLRRMFGDYTMIGVARTDGIRKGEWAAILYRTSRFKELGNGTFWLSEKPDQIGSRSWDAALERICTWVRLHDNVTGAELLHANTHFDHKGHVAQLESARLLVRRLPEIAGGVPVILTGDFNCTERDAPYRVLVSSGTSASLMLLDSYRSVHPAISPDEASVHGFKGTIAGARIDWILASPQWEPVSADIVRTHDERYPSDHYPVTAVFTVAR